MSRSICGCRLVPALLLILWVLAGGPPQPRRAALPGAPPDAAARADFDAGTPAVLALSDCRARVDAAGAQRTAGGGPADSHRRRRHRRAAGRLGVDVRPRPQARSLAAIGAIPARAGRIAAVARRPHRARAVRPHRRAAGQTDARSQYVFLLSRSSAARVALPAARGYDLGHQHRARHPLGRAAGARKTKSCSGARRTARRSCSSRTARPGAARSPRSLQLARSLDIPVHVVGVGTSYGGLIPQAPLDAGQTTRASRDPPARSWRSSTAPRCSRSPPKATGSTSTSIVTATGRSPRRSSKRRDDGPARGRSRRASKSCIDIACWRRPGCSAFQCCCCVSAPSSGSSVIGAGAALAAVWARRSVKLRDWVLGCLGARARALARELPHPAPSTQALKHPDTLTCVYNERRPSVSSSNRACSRTVHRH